MLEYAKLILEKVSFDDYLFGKEFNKALDLLSEKERRDLRSWCRQTYPERYHHLLRKSQPHVRPLGNPVLVA